MSKLHMAACAIALAAIGAGGPGRAQTAGAASLASPWVELHAARVRLIGGPGAAKAAKTYLAGVEITLSDGWKTYWRMPGDSGVPPVFSWAGSGNVAAVKVRYPAPMRLPEPTGDAIGYKRSVIFPIEVTPKDASKPVELKLGLEFGVCREICIPAEAKIALSLAPAGLNGTPVAPIAAALAAVPRPAAGRRAGDPEIERVAATLDGPAPRLQIEARFPGGDTGADLFVEAPDGLYVPMPQRVAGSSAGGTVRFEVGLARGGNAGDFKGKTLTLTLVSDAGATETTWAIP